MNDRRANSSREPREQRGRCRRALAAIVVLSVAAIVPMLTPSQPAAAATEVDWYVATPGFVRTNLQPTHVVGAPGAGAFYAVLEGKSASWTLLKISLADFSVEHEISVSGQGEVIDIEVSAAGAVYVLAASSVSRYSASDLSLVKRIPLQPGDPRDQISVAQDRADRFALYDVIVFNHAIYTGGQRASLDGLGLDNIGLVGFGTDSDQVLAVDTLPGSSAGVFATFDISGDPVVVDSVDDWMYGLGSVTDNMEVRGVGDDFAVVSIEGERGQVVKIDGQSLAVDGGLGFSHGLLRRRGAAIDFEAEQVFADDSSQKTMSRSALFELSVVPDTWTFPVQGYIEPVAALGDGLFAGFERSSGPEFLIIGSSDVLGGGFGDYHAVTPDRLLDTREAIGVPRERRLGPGETITVEVAGRGGLPADGVLAVTMNATVTEPTGSGFIKVWPTGVPFPEVSNLNYVNNQTVANAVTVTVGPDGNLQLFNPGAAAAHVLLDITGYYSNSDGLRGAQYVSNGLPERLLDTRTDPNPANQRLGPHEFVDVVVPSGQESGANFGIEGERIATAAVLSVTAVGGTAPSFLSVYPSDLPVRPTTSTLNFVAGDIRSNSVVAKLPSDNTIRIYNHAGTVDVVVDLFGHYSEFVVSGFENEDNRNVPVEQSGRYYPTTPYRRFDSREESPFPGTGALEPGSALILGNSAGWTDIWNVTTTEPTRAGFLSVVGYDDSGIRPDGLTSNVNFIANETIAAVAYATGTPDNAIYNANGFTHVIVDVFGFLTPEQLSSIDTAFSRVVSRGLTAASLPAGDLTSGGLNVRSGPSASRPNDATWFNP